MSSLLIMGSNIPRELTPEQKAALEDLRRAAKTYAAASTTREEAIRRASDLGITRRQVAEAAGLTAGRIQQIVGSGAGKNAKDDLTLHAAMVTVLKDARSEWLHVDEIARRIAERKLYIRAKDNQPAGGNQVRARASKYPHLFEGTTDGTNRVRLKPHD